MKPTKSCGLWVLIIIIFLGALALALWLDLRHQTPSFTITNFYVPTSTDSNQHPEMEITLEIKNPNKVYNIIYDYSVFTVKYDQRPLGHTDLLTPPGKHQGHQPKATASEVSDHVEVDIHQWKVLLKAVANSSKAVLEVELKVGIRYQNLGHRSKQYKLKYQGNFKIGPDGKISGGEKVKLCKGSC